jgi:hypothetical protein
MYEVLSFSIVTPSYNQVAFIERTIRSVLDQEVAELEYVVVDGGSHDGTVQILERYADRLWYRSEADEGQAHAINKGLALTSGDLIGWLNSDDIYYPGTLDAVRGYFAAHEDVDILYGNADHINEQDRTIEPYGCEPWDPERLRDVCFLCQPAVFFRRRVIERHGLLDASLDYCMDYEYWLRLAVQGAHFAYLPRKLAGSRMYSWNKTMGQRVAVHARCEWSLPRQEPRLTRERELQRDASRGHALGRAMLERGRHRFAAPWRCSRGGRRSDGIAGCPSRSAARRGNGSGKRCAHGGSLDAAAGDPASHNGRRRRLRVGLDVSQTGTRKAGCGYLTLGLVQALQDLGDANEYLLYRPLRRILGSGRDRRGVHGRGSNARALARHRLTPRGVTSGVLPGRISMALWATPTSCTLTIFSVRAASSAHAWCTPSTT